MEENELNKRLPIKGQALYSPKKEKKKKMPHILFRVVGRFRVKLFVPFSFHLEKDWPPVGALIKSHQLYVY